MFTYNMHNALTMHHHKHSGKQLRPPYGAWTNATKLKWNEIKQLTTINTPLTVYHEVEHNATNLRITCTVLQEIFARTTNMLFPTVVVLFYFTLLSFTCASSMMQMTVFEPTQNPGTNCQQLVTRLQPATWHTNTMNYSKNSTCTYTKIVTTIRCCTCPPVLCGLWSTSGVGVSYKNILLVAVQKNCMHAGKITRCADNTNS